MAQSARPVPPDLANSGWSPPAGGTGIAAAISISNSPSPPAAQIVTSTPDPVAAIFTVKLNPLNWPQNGDQVLRVLMNRVGPDAIPVTVALLQGTTPIASQTYTPPANTTFYEAVMDLSLAQKASITDYTALAVSVLAGPGMQVLSIDGPARITVTTTSTAGLVAGSNVTISGCVNNPWANRAWVVFSVIDGTHFTFDGGLGTGAEPSAYYLQN